jgi:hypothetical protein
MRSDRETPGASGAARGRCGPSTLWLLEGGRFDPYHAEVGTASRTG